MDRISIVGIDNQEINIRAYVLGQYAVHPAVMQDEDGAYLVNSIPSLTYIPSGCQVAMFETWQGALYAAEHLPDEYRPTIENFQMLVMAGIYVWTEDSEAEWWTPLEIWNASQLEWDELTGFLMH
jgi:hypothetical protein